MGKRIEVGVLGATGMVGQQFINQLAGHPWFELTWLAASERSEGKRYSDAASWRLETLIPDGVAERTVEACAPGKGPRLVFSALDASVAGELEQAFADAGHVVLSNARNHRMNPVVPLLVPEVNADHLGLLRVQARQRGGKGAIVTNPNCSTIVLSMALAPLRAFGLRACLVSTMQAVSGAGYPGVPSLDILGNVIPFISGEEEKIETETRKILGTLAGAEVEPHPVRVSAHTNRVPVVDGHTETVSVALEQKPSLEALRAAIDGFAGEPQRLRPAVGAGAAAPVPGPAEPAAAALRRRPRPRHDRVGREAAALRRPRLEVRGARPQHRARRGGRLGAERGADASPGPALAGRMP